MFELTKFFNSAWKLAVALLVILTFIHPSLADNEIKLSADIVDYQSNNQKIITAKGNVKIERLGETLISDQVIYNADTNEVEAIGNVIYKDTKGDVIYTDKLSINGDFKQASIHAMKMKTGDGDTIEALQAAKLDENNYQFLDAYYTPCRICESRPAIWSIRANDVRFDDEEKEMEYKHAKFYMGSLPILYLPYLSHSVKGAKRKSGILRMSAGHNSNLGTLVKIPYYLNFAPDRDATLTFIPTSKAGPVFEGEYRHLTDYGQYTVNGIFTKPDPKNIKTADFVGRTRYNVKSRGDFTFDKNLFLNYNVNYTSDQNFLRTYGYDNIDYTKSNITTTYHEKYNSIKVETLYFQNLRYGKMKDCNPVIAPHIQTYYEKNLDEDATTQFYNKSDYLYLHRNSSISINRFSINNGFKKTLITNNGHHFTFKTNLRTDLFSYFLNKPLPTKPTESDQNRIIPEFISEWNYPNYAFINDKLIIVEPLAQIRVSPAKNYNYNIYNEDSQDSELSFSNLFAENKFTGIDLVERGSRLSYGIKTQSSLHKKTNLGFMLGQSFSTSKYNKVDLYNQDYNSKLSSYVGLATINHDNTYIATYQFKIDNRKLGMLSNEVGLELRKSFLYFITEYVAYKDSYNLQNLLTMGRKEINFEIGTSYFENWQFSFKARNNLNKKFSNNFKRGLLNLETNVTYLYDCIGYKLKVYRDFTNPIGTKPSNGFTFGVILKNIN